MATYLGNPALSSAVKERVSTTFQQAVALYKQGRTDEVLAGCDLILKMDPQFLPARKLQEKTRNPLAPIDVDSLVPSSDADDALALARKAMAVRDFQQVVNITTEILTNDLLNDEARILGDEAREKIEAGPFVEQFFRKCEQHISAANVPLARQDLEKVRALDSDHPAIARMEAMIAGASLGPGTPAPPPPAATPFSFGAPAASPSPFDFSTPPSPSFVVDNAAGSSGSGRGTADAADFGFTFEEDKPPQPAMPSGGYSFDSVSATPPPRPTPPPAAPPPPQPSYSFGAPEPEAPTFGGFSFETPSAPPPPHGAGSSFDPMGSGGSSSGGFSFDQPAPAAPGGFNFDAPAPSSPAGAAFEPGAPAPASEPADFSFGAPAAPASGGFSFGAPEPSGFSFDSPSPAASAFDFTSGEPSPDDKRKIDQYLADGDRSFAAGEYQSAIDLWSRIFLIDVTNEQASDRIEKAKGKRGETEQRVEGMLTAAVAAYDRGDRDGATRQFSEILRLDPANETAVDYLDRINRGSSRPAAMPQAPAPFLSPSADSGDEVYGGTFNDGLADTDGTYGNTLMPPDPGTLAAATPVKTKADAKAAARSRSASRGKPKSLVMAAAIAGVVVILGGGYFAFTRFTAKPPASTVSGAAMIEQAKGHIGAGEYDRAIVILQEVPPNDPMHDRALEMIADLQHKKVQASEMIDGKPAMVVYQENLTNARTAFDAHDYMKAKTLLDQAAKIRPLPPEMKQVYDASSLEMSKLQTSLTLFKEGKYQEAVASLEPLLVQDPQNLSVKQLIGNAHFNLGAIALQNERGDEAIKQFDIVLQSNPADDAARRSKELALKYQGQPKDLLYKIYVKYLPLR